MIKRILKYIVYGFVWGCSWFVVQAVIFDLFQPEILHEIMENFTLHALGSIITGMAGATTAIVYTFPRLQKWQQTLIHMTVGLGIFFPIAFSLGWLPTSSWSLILSSATGSILIFLLISSGFYFYNRYEAKKINEQLKKLKK